MTRTASCALLLVNIRQESPYDGRWWRKQSQIKPCGRARCELKEERREIKERRSYNKVLFDLLTLHSVCKLWHAPQAVWSSHSVNNYISRAFWPVRVRVGEGGGEPWRAVSLSITPYTLMIKNFYTTKQTAEMQIARVESLSGTIRDNVFLNLSIIPGVFTFDYLICEHRGPELLRKWSVRSFRFEGDARNLCHCKIFIVKTITTMTNMIVLVIHFVLLTF